MKKNTQPSTAPVMVGSSFVDPKTGVSLSSIGKATSYDFARPTEVPDQYWIGPYTIDAATQSIIKTNNPEVRLENSEKVIRIDGAGKALWEYNPGVRVGSLRAPEFLVTDAQVFVAVSDGVIALSKDTGKLLWRSTGPQDHLVIFGENLIGVDCTSPSALKKRWMSGYDLKTGKESFRVETPAEEEPDTPVVFGDFLLVRGDKYSMLLDHAGKAILRRSDRISVMREAGAGQWLVVTDKTIAMLSSDGKELWNAKSFRDNFVNETHALLLDDGEVLLYNFCVISDSGVELVRLDQRGKELWRANVHGAGVDHSEYYHTAYVVPRGDALIVVSQGSYAKFLEVLDAKTGASVRRFNAL